MGKSKDDSQKNTAARDAHAFQKHSLSDAPEGKPVNPPAPAARKKEGVQKKQDRADKRQKKRTSRQEKKADRKKEIQEQLSVLYENADGTRPDMTQFEARRSGRLLRALAVLLLSCGFLAAAAWAAFFVLQPRGAFSEKDIILSVSGPETVAVGELAQYRVRYRNAGSMPLSRVRVHVRYPDGFVFEGASRMPDGEGNDEWTIGTVENGDSGFFDITGRVYNNHESEHSLRVFFNYLPGNFSSEFQKVATAEMRLLESPLRISVEGPAELPIGAESEFILIVESNKTEDDVRLPDRMAVRFEPGANFHKEESDPASDQFEPLQWTVSPGDGPVRIAVRGSFSAADAPEQDIAAAVVGWRANTNGEPFTLVRASQTVALTQTDVAAHLIVNGTSNDFTVSPGEVLNTSVLIKNTGQTDIQNISARVLLDGPSENRQSIFLWSALEDDADGRVIGEQLTDTRRRGVITWTSNQVRALRTLKNGEDVAIDFRLPIQSAQDTDLTRFEETTIEAVVELQYEIGGKQEVYTSPPITMTIASDLALEVRDAVEETDDGKERHLMKWVLTNSFHDLERVEVSTDIYGPVAVDADAAVVSAGEIQFDEKTKRLVWRMETLPRTLDVVALEIPIILNEKNPTQTNVTSQIELRAFDPVSGVEILRVGDGIQLVHEEN